MMPLSVANPVATEPPKIFPSASTADSDRVRTAVLEHYEFLWRSVRRLGVPLASVEDAAQQVLIVFSRRIADVRPGAERSFLFGTAARVAADLRKKARRSPEISGGTHVELQPDGAPSADATIDRARARDILDRALDDLPAGLREVFILAELEELTMASIAEMLGLAPGTVASRLRRARAAFEESARRIQRARSTR